MGCYVYVLGSDGAGGVRTYVGWTVDLDRRLARHNHGSGARSTRGRCWRLLYAERYATRAEAMSREWHSSATARSDGFWLKAVVPLNAAPVGRPARRRRGAAAEPALAAEPDQQADGDREHHQQRDRIAVAPVQLRHVPRRASGLKFMP